MPFYVSFSPLSIAVNEKKRKEKNSRMTNRSRNFTSGLFASTIFTIQTFFSFSTKRLLLTADVCQWQSYESHEEQRHTVLCYLFTESRVCNFVPCIFWLCHHSLLRWLTYMKTQISTDDMGSSTWCHILEICRHQAITCFILYHPQFFASSTVLASLRY